MYSLVVFAGGLSRSLFALIFPRQGRPPSTILGVRKLETLAY